MALRCQVASYDRSFTASITAVEKHASDGNVYKVTLDDTVLFPEGGGQPCDHGKIGGQQVSDVQHDTKTGQVVHTVVSQTPPAFKVGDSVLVEVDWARRWDHMQQHSGQHLITALAEKHFGLKTVSWSLGKDKSYIDLDPKATAAQVAELEVLVNEAIRSRLSMTPSLLTRDDPSLASVRSRGLPEHVTGPIRVVCIEGLDVNMCCGTHVQNLADLQSIKLLHAEPFKTGTRLYFVAGERVARLLDALYAESRALTKLFSSDDRVAEAEKLLKASRQAAKDVKTLTKEIGELIGRQYAAQSSRLVVLHRADGDVDFVNSLAGALDLQTTLMFVTVGDGEEGSFFLFGPEAVVDRLGPQAAALLNAKGGGKKGRYQGKAKHLSARAQVVALLQEQPQAASS